MHCSGCGKEIPFNGAVCPYCQRDKGPDQLVTTMVTLCVGLSMGVGYLVNGFVGLMWGGGVGLALGIMLGTPLAIAASKHTKPPEVSILVPPHKEPAPAPLPLSDRLEALNDLRKRELISEEEYDAKRRQILEDL